MILARYFILYTRINSISYVITAAGPGHPADRDTFWHRHKFFAPIILTTLYNSTCES